MISPTLVLSKEGAALLFKLREAAVEVDAICINAPVLWDADTIEDNNVAKEGCNGKPKSVDSDGFPPCPIRELCLETAMTNNEQFGVWGGLSVYERRKLKNNLKSW